MANGCPHRKQLESTLRACHDHTELITETRDNYLNIIDGLKNDLDELTAEVEQCRIKDDDFHDNEEQPNQSQQYSAQSASSSRAVTIATNGLEAAMYALAEHNERLQQALLDKCGIVASTQHTTDARIQQLEKHSTDLCQHIKRLTEELRDRETQIDQLNCELDRQAVCFENDKLDEITKLKKENCEQARCLHDLTSMLNSEKQNRQELCTKFDALDGCCNEVNKQLQSANNRARTLQDHFHCMQQQFEETKIERKLLRDELLGLKEKESVLIGRERGLCEQLKKSETELAKARKLICNMQDTLDQNDREHCHVKNKLRQAESENTLQLCQLKNDITQLQSDLEQQLKINMQKDKILDSFRKWQEDQRQSDEITRSTIQKTEEHIQMLMEDNRHYVEENREISRVIEIQDCEIHRLKSCGMSGTRQAGGGVDGNNSTNNDTATTRLGYLQNTTQRAAEQRRSLRASAANPSDNANNAKDGGNSIKSVR